MSRISAPSPFPAHYRARIHRAEVTAVERLGAGMVRIRFGGADLADYPTTGIGDEYVRVFFPDAPHEEPRIPVITSIRGWEYPEGMAPSEMRVYTIRQHTQGEVVIDFVSHEGGVAATWAEAARPGDAVGMNPPCGLYERPDALQSQILIADEPGLPAALRIAEETSATVRTIVLAEVRSPAHRIGTDLAAVDYRWIDRAGNGLHESGVLAALREIDIDDDCYVWVSTEGRVNREIRRYLRHERQLPAANYKCVAYWQERAEARRARLAELGAQFTAEVRAIRERGGDEEAIDDAVEALYESVGL